MGFRFALPNPSAANELALPTALLPPRPDASSRVRRWEILTARRVAPGVLRPPAVGPQLRVKPGVLRPPLVGYWLPTEGPSGVRFRDTPTSNSGAIRPSSSVSRSFVRLFAYLRPHWAPTSWHTVRVSIRLGVPGGIPTIPWGAKPRLRRARRTRRAATPSSRQPIAPWTSDFATRRRRIRVRFGYYSPNLGLLRDFRPPPRRVE